MSEPPLTDSQGDAKSEREKSMAGESDDGKSVPIKSNAGSRPTSAKSQGSNKSGRGDNPSPVTDNKDNPAADLRNMRRIIAEDPEWSLATVPLLVELCISHVVENFESRFSSVLYEI